MEEEDGGLARHNSRCGNNIEWENAAIDASINGYHQRKVLEGIESIRMQYRGITVLNNHEQLETWHPVLYEVFEND